MLTAFRLHRHIPPSRSRVPRLLAALIGFALCASASDAAAPPPRSLVVLVDTSTSMDDLMPRVHAGLEDLIRTLQPGDRCTLFAFGDEVRRVAEREITQGADVEALVALVAELQPTDRYTDITSALKRGIAALRRDAREHPDRTALLILLTDGRHNPPDPAASPSFESLTTAFEDFPPGEQWFLHYLVLRQDADDARARELVEALRGVYTLPEPEAVLADALTRMASPVRSTLVDKVGECSVRPIAEAGWRPMPAGTPVRAGQVAETGPASRAILVLGDVVRMGLDLQTAVEVLEATRNPLRGTGSLRVRVPAGTIEVTTRDSDTAWHFVVETPSGTLAPLGTRFRLAVDPLNGAAEVAVRSGAVLVHPIGATDGPRCDAGSAVALQADNTVGALRHISANTKAASRAWDDALDAGAPLATIGPGLVAAAWGNLTMRIGPLRSGAKLRQETRVPLAGLAPAALADARVTVKAALPPGLSLTATLQPPPAVGPHTVGVVLNAALQYQPEPDAEYAARVVLVTPGDDALAAFPVQLWTDKASPPEAKPRVATAQDTTGGWLVVAGFGAVVLLLVTFVYYRGPGVRGRTGIGSSGVGRLLVIENPVPAEWKQDFIRLGSYLTKGSQRTLSVGRSKYCDIVLPHESVREHHCNVTVWRKRGQAGARIELVKDAPVRVDDEPVRNTAVGLVDRAQIVIGEFTLQYEDSSAKPQVLVHLKSGETVRGALHSWDMTAPTFLFASDDPDVKLPGGVISHVAFADVEDIVMLAMTKGGKPRRRGGTPVVVAFARGRRMRGTLWADYDPDSPLFSLFPAEQDGADYVVVVRANTLSVEVGDVPER